MLAMALCEQLMALTVYTTFSAVKHSALTLKLLVWFTTLKLYKMTTFRRPNILNLPLHERQFFKLQFCARKVRNLHFRGGVFSHNCRI
jgi:hypothetical protein